MPGRTMKELTDPQTGGHNTQTADCWCLPDVLELCPACCGDEPDQADCWRCKGWGLVLSEDPAADGPAQVVVHHNIGELCMYCDEIPKAEWKGECA